MHVVDFKIQNTNSEKLQKYHELINCVNERYILDITSIGPSFSFKFKHEIICSNLKNLISY